jgi:hypothetical protein
MIGGEKATYKSIERGTPSINGTGSEGFLGALVTQRIFRDLFVRR